MKLLVTGATGFIGSHLVPRLLDAKHQLTVITRNFDVVNNYEWAEQVKWIEANVYQLDDVWLNQIGAQDAVVHLAWHGLPNYQATFHVDENLPAEKQFLMAMVELGIKQLLVTGTCFEYGNLSGCVDEEMQTEPDKTNSYAVAKDQLRQFLQEKQVEHQFILQWTRLFYMYGEGQNPKSLLMQLQAAIDSEQPVFNMSGGEQQRDYLHVEKVADYLLNIMERCDFDGIVNICSGQPIKIKTLVEKFVAEKNAKIMLNYGFYPYPQNEAMAFWGSNLKLNELVRFS